MANKKSPPVKGRPPKRHGLGWYVGVAALVLEGSGFVYAAVATIGQEAPRAYREGGEVRGAMRFMKKDWRHEAGLFAGNLIKFDMTSAEYAIRGAAALFKGGAYLAETAWHNHPRPDAVTSSYAATASFDARAPMAPFKPGYSGPHRRLRYVYGRHHPSHHSVG